MCAPFPPAAGPTWILSHSASWPRASSLSPSFQVSPLSGSATWELFTSYAIYPVGIMPGWLQVIAHSNPLSYEVDALRTMMLAGGTSTTGLGWDFLILFVVTTVLVLISARLYPRVAY